MASQPEKPTGAIPVVDVDPQWCSEPLTEPMMDFDLQQPLTLNMMNGSSITLRAGTSLYVSPYDIGYMFGNELQDLKAKIQREEEERWLRMTPEQVEKARAAYIPF